MKKLLLILTILICLGCNDKNKTTVNDIIQTNKLSTAINKELNSSLWIKVGETDYENYLYSFKNDTIFSVNRKGGTKYRIEGSNLIVNGIVYKIGFKTLTEFTINKNVFRKATFIDSIIGQFEGVCYPNKYNIIMDLNGNLIDGVNTFKYSYKNDTLKMNNFKLKRNKDVYFLTEDTIHFKGLKCNKLQRIKSEQINFNDCIK